MKRLEGLARFLEHDYESATRSLREGMAEMFTIQKLVECAGARTLARPAGAGLYAWVRGVLIRHAQQLQPAPPQSPLVSFSPPRASYYWPIRPVEQTPHARPWLVIELAQADAYEEQSRRSCLTYVGARAPHRISPFCA